MENLDKLRQFCKVHQPRIALILGSGWGDLVRHCSVDVELSYLDVPGLNATTVPGHSGKIVLGHWNDAPVILFAGRLHYYEGHPWRRVLEPVQIARHLGAETLILTNAAGGIRADLRAGSLMALTGHLSWVGARAWEAFTRDPAGAVVVREPYCPRLRGALLDAAASLGIAMSTGVYAQVTGPCYETPAEVRALRACGADAVGMSTGRESEAARKLGMRCIGLSCITNAAAGMSAGPIHHEEVTTVAGEKSAALAAVLGELIRRLSARTAVEIN